jgi:hypothetical protein
MDAVQQYIVAVVVLGGPAYPLTSQHARWMPALQAAAGAPAPGASLAEPPGEPNAAQALPAWRALRAAAACSAALLGQMQETHGELQAERIDLALAAADAKHRLAGAAAAAPPARAAAAFASFAAQQAQSAGQLASSPPGAAVLDGLQHLVLGFTTAAVALRDAAPLPAADAADPWAAGAAMTWLGAAVQCVDAVGGLGVELQLLAPSLAALLESAGEAAAVDAAAAHVAAQLAALALAHDAAGAAGGGADPEEAAAQVMEALLGLSGQVPAAGGLLRILQALHAAADALALASRGGPGADPGGAPAPAGSAMAQLHAAMRLSAVDPGARECLELGAAAVDTWRSVAAAWRQPAAAPAAPPVPWEELSGALAGAVAGVVQRRVLPAVQALMQRAAGEAGAAAARLPAAPPERASAEPGGHAGRQLQPFADFALPGLQGVLLSQAAGSPLPIDPGLGLAPFVDFDGALGGAGGPLDGSLEPEGVDQSDDADAGWGALVDDGDDPLDPLEAADPCGDGDGGSEGGLAAALSACAEAAGGLAAVDALQFVAAAALQQAQPQAQRHAAELAAFQWRHE